MKKPLDNPENGNQTEKTVEDNTVRYLVYMKLSEENISHKA